jgi:phosphate acetyltransferase
MDLIARIKENAKKNKKTIVLPEGTEERTLKAADVILREGLANLVLIGNKAEIEKLAAQFNLSNIAKAKIVDPLDHEEKAAYIEAFLEMRKSKGLQPDQAKKLMEDPLYLAAMMVKMGAADGEVAGAANATGDVLRPAFQIVKTKPGISVVSGAFFMMLK